MDQGTAAVIAAGFGIAGTLGGALGGAWFAGRAALQQVRAQGTVSLLHKIRDERRAAYTALVERRNEIIENYGLAMGAHLSSDNARKAELVEEWRTRIAGFQGAVAAVEISGPDEVFDKASVMANALIDFGLTLYDGRDFSPAVARDARPYQVSEEVARRNFVAAVRQELSGPGDLREG